LRLAVAALAFDACLEAGTWPVRCPNLGRGWLSTAPAELTILRVSNRKGSRGGGAAAAGRLRRLRARVRILAAGLRQRQWASCWRRTDRVGLLIGDRLVQLELQSADIEAATQAKSRPPRWSRQQPIIDYRGYAQAARRRLRQVSSMCRSQRRILPLRPVRQAAIVLGVAVTRPDSIGTLTLASPDPSQAPRIDLNFLAEARDRRRLLEGVKLSRTLGRTSPFADLVALEMFRGQRWRTMRRSWGRSAPPWTLTSMQPRRRPWAASRMPRRSSTGSARYAEWETSELSTHRSFRHSLGPNKPDGDHGGRVCRRTNDCQQSDLRFRTQQAPQTGVVGDHRSQERARRPAHDLHRLLA
jgi:hypothetical protein